MTIYSGWHLTHTGEVPTEDKPELCPLCGKVPDVVTFSCPVCDRDTLCFYHRRGERAWKASGRRVVIPECCEECWVKEYRRRQPQIKAIKRIRVLEIIASATLMLLLLSIALLFVSTNLAIAAMAVIVVMLAVLARFYFRAARDLPEASEED